jgi:hypothetical protein
MTAAIIVTKYDIQIRSPRSIIVNLQLVDGGMPLSVFENKMYDQAKRQRQ